MIVATSIRTKASPPATLPSISDSDRKVIADESRAIAAYWTNPPSNRKALVDDFRSDIKNHYYSQQSRRCCYCSFELQKHHATFDAEHVLDRSTHPEFAFELKNLAASCRPCNGSKGIKNPLTTLHVDGEPFPYTTNHYKILHPHLDDWLGHLEFDDLTRISAKDGSPKGVATIDFCNITALNCARLSDYFVGDQSGAETALRGFFRVKQKARRRAYLSFLRELADRFHLAQAKAIVERLEKEEMG